MAKFADPWLRWLLAAAVLIATTAVCVLANAQGQALPVDAACLVQCSDGSAGTGVLVDVTTHSSGEARGLVLTNWHVCEDAIASGGTYAATFTTGHKHGALLVAYNAELDLAALEIATPHVAAAPWTDRLEGELFYTAGFAGNLQNLRVTCGKRINELESGGQLTVEIDAPSRSGDSGGPVFNEAGEVCGIRWGTSGPPGTTQGPDTYFVEPSQVAGFLKEIGVTKAVAQQQWPGQVCSPFGGCTPIGGCSPFSSCSPCQPSASPANSRNVCQQNPDGTWSCPSSPSMRTRPAVLPGTRIVSPRTATPSTPSAPSAPSSPASAACDCTADLATINKRLDALEQRKPEPGPAGPAGPVGPAGPAGKDGANGSDGSVDEAAIAERVAAIVLAQQPPTSGVSHYVLVADEASSYWPRLSAEYRRAREVYSQIRLSGVPNVPVGALPQLVAYRDGKPLGAFRGARDVSDALARIARNEPPQP